MGALWATGGRLAWRREAGLQFESGPATSRASGNSQAAGVANPAITCDGGEPSGPGVSAVTRARSAGRAARPRDPSRCRVGAGAGLEQVPGWSRCRVGAGAGLEQVPGWSRCRVGAGAGLEQVPGWSRCRVGAGAGLERQRRTPHVVPKIRPPRPPSLIFRGSLSPSCGPPPPPPRGGGSDVQRPRCCRG